MNPTGASPKGKHSVTNKKRAHTRVEAAGAREARRDLEPEVAGADDVPMSLYAFYRPPIATVRALVRLIHAALHLLGLYFKAEWCTLAARTWDSKHKIALHVFLFFFFFYGKATSKIRMLQVQGDIGFNGAVSNSYDQIWLSEKFQSYEIQVNLLEDTSCQRNGLQRSRTLARSTGSSAKICQVIAMIINTGWRTQHC